MRAARSANRTGEDHYLTAAERSLAVRRAVKTCYCETVKNVTVAIPDDVYRRARIRAAERDTSVSAMVRDFLLQVDGADADFERGQALQAEVMGHIERFRGGDRLKRDELHQRDALR